MTDQNYIEIIKKTIGDIKQNDVMEDKSQFWDYVKCRIGSETIAYCIQRTKLNKAKEKGMSETLQTLENLLATDHNRLDHYHYKTHHNNISAHLRN